MSTSLQKVLDTHAKVIEEEFTQHQVRPRYKSYAVTNLRGGVGKSTLAFNLAYEISRERSLLLGDLCRNATLLKYLCVTERGKLHYMMPSNLWC